MTLTTYDIHCFVIINNMDSENYFWFTKIQYKYMIHLFLNLKDVLLPKIKKNGNK